MSGVLHPVGPEPERTYWLRRAALLMVLVLSVALLIGVAGLFGGGSSATAGPAGETTEAPPTTASQTPTADPTVSVSPTSSSAPSSTPSSTPRTTAAPPLDPTASSSATTSASAKAKSALPTAAPRPAACSPSALRATLMGPRRLNVDQDAVFSVSLINGSSATCTVAVTPSSFELKIYSGTDRIWSTNDCTKAVRPASATLGPEKALAWKQAWNGRRSADKCASKASLPRAGVYWATAQLDGAKPVQLRMILR